MITFQYFEGCPNANETLENLKQVTGELGIPESDVALVEVPDPALAEGYPFRDLHPS